MFWNSAMLTKDPVLRKMNFEAAFNQFLYLYEDKGIWSTCSGFHI